MSRNGATIVGSTPEHKQSYAERQMLRNFCGWLDVGRESGSEPADCELASAQYSIRFKRERYSEDIRKKRTKKGSSKPQIAHCDLSKFGRSKAVFVLYKQNNTIDIPQVAGCREATCKLPGSTLYFIQAITE